RAAPPHLSHLGDVDVVLVGLRIAQWCGLGVDGTGGLARVGVPDDGQPFRDRAHHPVLDTVVDHLDEVAGAVGPTVQVPLRGGPVTSPVRRGLRTAPTGGDAGEDRVEPSHRLVLAADHQAVSTFQTPHAAGGTAVHEVDLVRGELPGAGDVVAVVGVSP